ncbi:uridylate-specific endoribonuclease D-like [Mytilus californianus]|uniref:uridylate-specific endoribonuclease D-like n=1 Tax=Mytilus californianus TaxID=6549 RepID=UPI002247E989|nr:uridylate-specific endoribonuclease D-like [Mytilus californianus]
MCKKVFIFAKVLVLTGVVTCVEDTELSTLITSLWNSDSNAATSRDLHYSYQQHTDTSSSTDNAPKRLFSYVNENYLFHKPTYRTFLDLLDNYKNSVGTAEHVTNTEVAEELRFVNEICKTSIMQKTQQFLHKKGYVSSSMSDFEHILKSVWFTTYPRSGSSRTLDSSGFEHIFVGEVKGSSVDGFHNWIQFYLEEKKGHANYLGYVFRHQPGILGVHFKWYNSYKKLSSLILGSSPEFEMACYTLCYYLHRNRDCQFNINGHTIRVKTYEVDNMPGDQIATAYL